MTVFKSKRPFWKRFTLQSGIISGLFVILLSALIITGKTEPDPRWALILFVLLVSFFVDHLKKINIESVSFDADHSQLVIEFFVLFKQNKKIVRPFEGLRFMCCNQSKQSTLFIYGFSGDTIILDRKFGGFTMEQISGMQALIWSINLPIETTIHLK